MCAWRREKTASLNKVAEAEKTVDKGGGRRKNINNFFLIVPGLRKTKNPALGRAGGHRTVFRGGDGLIIGEPGQKSMEILQDPVMQEVAAMPSQARVFGFIDGFNFYHALERFEPSVPVADPARYRKYKWVCLTTLMQRFVRARSEVLAGVAYFTAYPNWQGSEAKRRRHEVFVAAQRQKGVEVILGEFKPTQKRCQAQCRQMFTTYVEKQTDINIAVKMVQWAERYDKAILLTADSDQVPVIQLLRSLYPKKRFASLPPIGRGAKDLRRVCHEQHKMAEEHLASSQLANPLPMMRNGQPSGGYLVKPTEWE